MNRPVSATAGGAALSRELADFLVQLSITLHKHGIYPPAHPMLSGAVEGVVARLADVLASRSVLSLGVARQQLVIEGIATDPDNPLLRELAQRLHRHHLSAVRFSLGVTADEIQDFITTVAVDADRTGDPIGIHADRMGTWPHIRLRALSYDQLRMLDQEDAEKHAEGSKGGSSIWIDLARAALGVEEGKELSRDPTLIAQTIDAGSREVAYDQVIVGYLLRIGSELKSAGLDENPELRREVTELVRALRPETVRRLLGRARDNAQRREFVLDAAQGMAAEAVLEVVKAAADASGETISHSLLRLLSKLAAHAGRGDGGVQAQSDAALREQVTRLVSKWELEDPNPDSYRSVLEGMSRAPPSDRASETPTAADPPRVVAMSIEVDVVGPSTWTAVEDMLANGQATELFEFIGDHSSRSQAAAEIWQRIVTTDRIRAVLATEPVDTALLERMVASLGMAAAEPMLDALLTAQLRATRWKLLTLIEQLGAEVGPIAVARLPAAPWYAQRNLLLILGKLPVLPSDFAAAPYARHSDARVRREAVRILLKQPIEREAIVVAALADTDEQVVRLALNAAAEDCPVSAAPLVARHAAEKAWEPNVRALALRVLAPIRSAETIETLLHSAMAKRTLFARGRLAPRSPEMLAALAGLAAHWREDHRAERALKLARRSADSEIRAAVGRQSR